MSQKTNKLAIYLIKMEYQEYDKIVKPDAKPFPIGDIGIFYAEESYVRAPNWVEDFFGNALAGKLRLLTASSKGLLLVDIKDKEHKRIFAIAFGTGRYLLNDDVIEERFGLKVVLNTVTPDSLRSIDKTILGSIPKQSREQMSREGGAENFGINIEQDLVSAVTGQSKIASFGKTISGKDSLSISVKKNAEQIKPILMNCLEQYQSESYKANFGWIDQIREVRDSKTVERLDQWLIEKFKGKDFTKIWMAPPTILDWVDVKGFSYTNKKALHQDLDIREFISAWEQKNIDSNLVGKKKIKALSIKSDDVLDQWTAYRCFYAEAQIDSSIFVLNNGKWYEIAAGFTNQVLEDFDKFPESNMYFPNYNHMDEGSYNIDLPTFIPNSVCMDRKMISHGGGHSSIEFCDLFTADNKIIHVKRYGGAAQLSHLFNQGVVSGELFLQDEEFRLKLNEKLPDDRKLVDTKARPNAHDYEVIFAIISKSNNPLEIPFFSKVSLRNARRRLQGYGYSVTKKKIIIEVGGST
ncbi:MAG TPA: TIGR04141 family sporadically distributed protein [Dongiaceae bacterium]|jgi:uncharacterized protein (TIGR04141 family)|nr:TIGR04141 family sporadically distributed protein [Dongiaceae bacterium]